jgi:hypothetical protein
MKMSEFSKKGAGTLIAVQVLLILAMSIVILRMIETNNESREQISKLQYERTTALNALDYYKWRDGKSIGHTVDPRAVTGPGAYHGPYRIPGVDYGKN